MKLGLLTGSFFYLLMYLVIQSSHAEQPGVAPVATQAPVAAPSAVPEKACEPEGADSGYEIDYEEEPDESAPAEEEKPIEQVPAKKAKRGTQSTASSNKSNVNNSVVQGSRAMNRFQPLLKSDTKSIYKKNGKNLDVDAD